MLASVQQGWFRADKSHPHFRAALLSLLLTDWTEALALCSEVFPSVLSDWLWAEERLTYWFRFRSLMKLTMRSKRGTQWQGCWFRSKFRSRHRSLRDKDSLKEASEVWLDTVSDDAWLFTWLLNTGHRLRVSKNNESDAAKRSVLTLLHFPKSADQSSIRMSHMSQTESLLRPVVSTPLSTVWPWKQVFPLYLLGSKQTVYPHPL